MNPIRRSIFWLFFFFGLNSVFAARLLYFEQIEDLQSLRFLFQFDSPVSVIHKRIEEKNLEEILVKNCQSPFLRGRIGISHKLAVSAWFREEKKDLKISLYPRPPWAALYSKISSDVVELKIPNLYPLRKDLVFGSKKNWVVCIDPGHGGQDPGAVGLKSQEKDIVLQVGRQLVLELNSRAGIAAFLTRDQDYKILLEDRPLISDRAGADVFLSLHMNAFKKSSRGFEIFYLSEKGAGDHVRTHIKDVMGEESEQDDLNRDVVLEKILAQMKQVDTMNVSARLATELMIEMAKIKELKNRGISRQEFMVLKTFHTPSLLIEMGFITNPEDENFFLSKKKIVEFCKKVANGIENFFQGGYTTAKSEGMIAEASKYPLIKKYPQMEQKIILHKIVSGDTVLKIGRKYEVNISDILRYNPGMNPQKIRVGDLLSIPILVTKEIVEKEEKNSSLH